MRFPRISSGIVSPCRQPGLGGLDCLAAVEEGEELPLLRPLLIEDESVGHAPRRCHFARRHPLLMSLSSFTYRHPRTLRPVPHGETSSVVPWLVEEHTGIGVRTPGFPRPDAETTNTISARVATSPTTPLRRSRSSREEPDLISCPSGRSDATPAYPRLQPFPRFRRPNNRTPRLCCELDSDVGATSRSLEASGEVVEGVYERQLLLPENPSVRRSRGRVRSWQRPRAEWCPGRRRAAARRPGPMSRSERPCPRSAGIT